ncbi:MAG: SDR family NAD(P)-dependent oxidoreductase, partial [Anaerolineae bacterium]|nr:SDR family NAD(P)-dependent oxidoreductase [Anaerolineae bacterium]
MKAMTSSERATRAEPYDPPSAGWASQCALITGASHGLGKAFAAECASRGMDLLLVALPDSGLEQVVSELRERYGVRSEWVAMDLTTLDGPERLSQWVMDLNCPLTMLINNAGVSYNSRFEDSTLQENESIILLNNLALVKITHLLLPELRKRDKAWILNVASMAAFFPMPFVPVYAPSKAFILYFSLALRQEMLHSPVHVSVLCPNGIRTNSATRRRIAAHGLISRLTCMDAEPVAAYALRQVLARRAIIVPGFLNQVIRTVGQYAPRR